jgi:hypothetical protein
VGTNHQPCFEEGIHWVIYYSLMFMPTLLIGIREVQRRWLKKKVILAEHSQQDKKETESMSKGKKPEAA